MPSWLVASFVAACLAVALALPGCEIQSLCAQQTSATIANASKAILQLSLEKPSDHSCVSIERVEGVQESSPLFCASTRGTSRLLLSAPFSALGLAKVQVLQTNRTALWANTPPLWHFFKEAERPPDLMSAVAISSPPFGAHSTENLRIEVQPFGEAIDQLLFEVDEIGEYSLPSNISFITAMQSDAIEPGSWFYSILPRRSARAGGTAGALTGLPSFGYIEFILPRDQLIHGRLFQDHSSPASVARDRQHRQAAMLALSAHFQGPRQEDNNDRIDLCIWTSNVMDGQKRIWLQQADFLDHNRFSFAWILSLNPGSSVESEQAKDPSSLDGTLLAALLETPGASILDSPFNSLAIPRSSLVEVPVDGDFPASQWSVEQNTTALFSYMHLRFQKANGQIDQVSPSWCRDIFKAIRSLLAGRNCDILVYGNNRGFGPDVLITDVAKSMGIPTVTELLNLFLHENVLPNVVIAPSMYALQHESIRSTMATGSPSPVGVVISPAVDLNHFHPAALRRGLAGPRPCRLAGAVIEEKACVTVGFVARTSIGKNPGLFLQMARLVLDAYPFARFVVIGKGKLLQRLQELAERLHIADKVHFRGFVSYPELPSHLRDLDIVVNPSLRGWSETFCIANIEVMAMSIPLVTFAVGGVGEYIAATQPSHPSEEWTISNAVVVHSAQASSLAAAVLHLIKHPAVMRSLGAAGRQSLLSYFHLERQMDQYTEVYEAIYAATRRAR